MDILSRSLAGSLLILAALLARRVSDRVFSRRMVAALWTLAELRLLVPYALPLPLPAAASPALPGWTVLLYRAVALGLGLMVLTVYLLFLLRVQGAVRLENSFTRRWRQRNRLLRPVSFRQTGKVDSPATYGTLRPVVLVPLEERWENEGLLSLVFSHEYAHIRRLDALRKLALAFCAAVHWFNPLVWLMLAVMPGDLELACDEAVIARLGHGYRRAYCLALLNMEERRQISLFGCSFAKTNLEKRIRSVMNMKPKSSLSVVLSLALILCLFGMTAGADTSRSESAGEKAEALALSWLYENYGTYYEIRNAKAQLSHSFQNDKTSKYTVSLSCETMLKANGTDELPFVKGLQAAAKEEALVETWKKRLEKDASFGTYQPLAVDVVFLVDENQTWRMYYQDGMEDVIYDIETLRLEKETMFQAGWDVGAQLYC
ncbi:MAG: M56 family metallopeptidase [bacterium]